mgnify:CR=1 FL=1
MKKKIGKIEMENDHHHHHHHLNPIIIVMTNDDDDDYNNGKCHIHSHSQNFDDYDMC